jgi:ABC-type lipoprotein release transport system permease subunit
MSQNFRIALRFLTAKKRAMLMSLSCIVLGVGLFIVTQARRAASRASSSRRSSGRTGPS